MTNDEDAWSVVQVMVALVPLTDDVTLEMFGGCDALLDVVKV